MILKLDKDELATLKVVLEAWEKKNVFVTRNEPNRAVALNRLWRKVVAETLDGLEEEEDIQTYIFAAAWVNNCQGYELYPPCSIRPEWTVIETRDEDPITKGTGPYPLHAVLAAVGGGR